MGKLRDSALKMMGRQYSFARTSVRFDKGLSTHTNFLNLQ